MVQAVAQYLAEEVMEWLLDQTPNLPDLHRHTHAQMDLHLLAKKDNGHEYLEINTTIHWNIALYYIATIVWLCSLIGCFFVMNRHHFLVMIGHYYSCN